MDERDQELVDEHQSVLHAGAGAYGPLPRPRDRLCLVTLMPWRTQVHGECGNHVGRQGP